MPHITSAPAPLDPLRFPFTGSHLIEASAGTGKTFTIAMLYVRLVLGHGGEAAFKGGALTPPAILVVTFTDAATQELRDRIRARLAEAARAFREDPASSATPAQGDLLQALRASYAGSDWPACARRLELAAEWMDEAAVSTIHGWCNRMLREHAFDSQSLFRLELETDASEIVAEVVRDYWRRFFYPLDRAATAAVRSFWADPASLQKAVKPLLPYTARLPTKPEPAATLGKVLGERETLLRTLKAPWPAWADELEALFSAARPLKQFNGNKLRESSVSSWLQALRDWAAGDALLPGVTEAFWPRFTPAGIADAWKGEAPAHPAFAAVEAMKPQLDALPTGQDEILSHAASWIAGEFAATQRRRSRVGFDDLLTGLDAALHGPNGDRLADTIRRQFPVALIDEFQDTDPTQYRIFERIYQIAENRQDCALTLIGDPKQAIYAFRGADIFTYLKARQAMAERLFTLDTNYRSTQGMVSAANHCFARIEHQPDSVGAFRFREAGHNPVPFLPVKAHGRKDDFVVDAEAQVAMTLAVLPETEALPKDGFIARMAALCATRIVTWLNEAQAGKTGFACPGEALRPLRPGDIAVLVNTGKEANQVRQALARRGVRSVYLSDRGSVFSSALATEILYWLEACAAPDDERLLRAALSTRSLGLSFATLDNLNHDEEALETRVVQFKAYREQWQKHGVLPMLRRLLLDFGCSERMLGVATANTGENGERILTDILHLAELLQQASFALEGEHALIRWLAEQIAAPEGDADGRRQRLESDEALVQVITIHKSKGLEYPVVCLPFLCAARQVSAKDAPLKWHDDTHTPQIALSPDPAIVAAANEERLGEDLRKAYVALTRARYHTWLGLGPVKDGNASAIAYLTGMNGPAAPVDAIRAFAAGLDCFTLIESPIASDACHSAENTADTGRPARRPVRVARENWWISSYSSLHIEGHASAAAPGAPDDSPQAENLRERELDLLPPGAPRAAAIKPMHRFFRGAEAGTFLHELMEWVAANGFATTGSRAETLRDTIARRCRVRGWDGWVDPLFEWVTQMETTPLPLAAGQTLCLGELKQSRAEMEFWFEARQVNLAELDSAVIAHTLGGMRRPALAAEMLNGMLKGFIDLVFEHEGRYYVADYKSNWLGPTDEDYTAHNMKAAVCAHRYDLQYVIYLFALHRLLRSRLPDYDYDRHIGGALYLFVRGLQSGGAGVHFERPPKQLMEILDDIFTGSAATAA
jgi:exodeoxyribonuclease V beta subunit